MGKWRQNSYPGYIVPDIRNRQSEHCKLKQLMEQYQHISEWSDVFDGAGVDEKKMILSRLIEKITVDRNYHITIYFYITLDQFKESLESLEKTEYNVTIEDGQAMRSAG